MVKIYACLIGEWVCLNDDPECKFVDSGKSPNIWWEENSPIYAPKCLTRRNKEGEENICVKFARDDQNDEYDSFYQQDYVKILFKGKIYRINPVFIQVVYE